MDHSIDESKKVVRCFLDAYLARRDLTAVLACLAQHVQWVGTGRTEVAIGREAVTQMLIEDITALPDGFDYELNSIRGKVLQSGETMFLLIVRIMQAEIRMEPRVSLLCVMEAGEWKIASVHASTPNALQQEFGFFPMMHDADAASFGRRVGARAVDLLEQSIPGGILAGYAEPGLPIYFINDRMLEYLGYTRGEFIEAMNGLLINCVHPDDREWVERTTREKAEESVQQYRIRKRDGSSIWVSDVGKRATAEDGREICISVIRDITKEVEDQHRLQEEAAEKAREAWRFDRLYQSVLCGIVQYRMNVAGGILFESANPEAMRILGYEHDEFWAKDDWDFPSLIDEADRERVLADFDELRRVGDTRTYEYRLRQKDGTPCWIIGSAEILLNADGLEVVQSVFLDINRRKGMERRNRLLAEQVEASNELLRMALEHTTTCECYYHTRERRLRLPERTREYYNIPAHSGSPELFAEDCLAEECRADFCAMIEQIDRGEHTASAEFRFLGQEVWCRATFSTLQYEAGEENELAVGILEDITREKQMEQALSDTHARDSLTGVYNKEFGVRMVQECLQQRREGECYGMMLLDMDDFERINTEEGMAFADALLQEVADVLSSEVGDDGVCVRLGGDEFMLLLRNHTKADMAITGPRIVEEVRSIFAKPEKGLAVSVSIGMCVTDVAPEYAALYRCAESTLKYVKEHARGTAACYLDTSNERGISLTQLYTDEHPVTAIERTSAMQEEDLISFALELLGKSKKLDDAIFLLFSRIGKNLGLDRVSIMEVDRDYLSYCFSYQWARNRADLQLGQDFYVSADRIENIASMYDGDGLCERTPSASFTRFGSILHAGIWNYGEYAGSMCFEMIQPDYRWSDEQRKMMKEMVKIVPSFLLKARADAISKAKSEFLSRISHEIRTPMNAISGMTTIAKSVLDDKEKTLDCLDKIESANGYLLELINDILDMSRIESGKLELHSERLDIGELLARLDSLLLPQAIEKGLSLHFENGYMSNRPLMGDGLRLNQVLINLIGNAIKFTDEGGAVSVRLEELAVEPGARLRFSVKDTGIGIEKSALKRIFNAFEQAERNTTANHGGTGLGLAISSRLVQLMGGQLEVRSEVGKGSEFFFTIELPYASEQMLTPTPPVPHPVIEHDFSGLRLLVAEDNELNQEIVKTILEMHGFLTVCVSNGAEAVAEFQRQGSGHFAAVLMDIRMPVMDGLEATRRIRTSGQADARSIPIIALTANAFDEDSRKSVESGMDGHLSKPLQIEQLLDLLDRCLND